MAGTTLIDPRFLTWEQWSAFQTGVNTQYTQVDQTVPESEWRSWAAVFVASPQFSGLGLPWPNFFSRWQDWVNAINHVFAMAAT